MRADEPNRHGRAADALIASYLRELSADAAPPADTTRLGAAIVANREGESAPLGVPTQPAEGQSAHAAA
jgi:hypothetical protein